jgi:hypothetical protein
MSAPSALLAVKIKPGQVTEREWLEALADRVQELAEKAGPEETLQASQMLDLPPTSPESAGEYLVLGNWNLQEFLRASATKKHPFPAKAQYNPDAVPALEINLSQWADLAASQVKGSYLE